MIDHGKLKEKGRIARGLEQELERVSVGSVTYIVMHSTGGIPCSACHISPCSKKPKELEPCPCFLNKYGKNIYFRKIVKTQIEHGKNTRQKPAETI